MGTKETGRAVKVVRTRYDIMQYKLAMKLGWHVTSLYHVEAGNRRLKEAERDAIVAHIAELAKKPIEDIVAMLSEEERRR